jgi:hypothetical protein
MNSCETGFAVDDWMLVRIASLPLSFLDEIQSHRISEFLRRHRALLAEYSESREATSAILFASVGAAQHVGERRALLSLRRALQNGTIPRDSVFEAAQAALGGEAMQRVEAQIARLKECAYVAASLHACFQQERDRAARSLCSLLQERMFRASVHLSSVTLGLEAERWLDSTVAMRPKRQVQLERGLLRYATRAAAKATPFAGFCAVGASPTRLPADGNGIADSHEFSALGAPRAVARPNKRIYGLLWAALKKDSETQRWLDVSLNASVSWNEERYSFLVNAGTREAFRRVKRSASLDTVVDALRSLGRASCARLCERLLQVPEIDTTPGEAHAFIASLAEAGLLRLHGLVPEQSVEWPELLADKLMAIPSPLARRIGESLGRYRQLLASADAQANHGEREAVVLKDAVRTLLESAGYTGAAVDVIPLFEDYGYCEAVPLPVVAHWDRCRETLEQLSELLMRYAYPSEEHGGLRRFFDGQYAADSRVPVLEFYEDLYRQRKGRGSDEVARPELAGAADKTLPRAGKTPRDRALHAFHILVKEVWASAPTAEALDLPLTAVSSALASGLDRRGPLGAGSLSCFGSFCDGDTARFVLKGAAFSAGYGKFFSRFLHLLPTEVTSHLRDSNMSLHQGVLVDFGGEPDFNANLRPALTPSILAYPYSEVDPSASTINVSELYVERDKADDARLCLVADPNDTRVIPVDLGFLAHARRSPLHRLLTELGPPIYGRFSLPSSLEETVPLDRIIYRPRVTVNQVVILARRQWSVPGPQVPQPASGEEGADYLLRLDDWRASNGIPVQVYVRLEHGGPGRSREDQRVGHNHPQQQDADVVDAADEAVADRDGGQAGLPVPGANEAIRAPVVTMRKDDYKPQYVDFSSPLLIDLFGRMASGLEGARMVIEESLPDREEVMRVGGERRVSECVLQFVRPAERREEWQV